MRSSSSITQLTRRILQKPYPTTLSSPITTNSKFHFSTRTMATATSTTTPPTAADNPTQQISLDPITSTTHTQYFRPEAITLEASQRTSTLLQQNHDIHHIFFNASGFHNHIAHHLLSLWALGANPSEIQQGYDENTSYQRPSAMTHKSIIDQLHDPAVFTKHLSQHQYYSDYLAFFKQQMARSSWQEVLQTYVFSGDALAEEMFTRLYGGLLHPLIHIGFGVEFNQPLIVAEGLAEAACSSGGIGEYLGAVEKKASSTTPTSEDIFNKPLIDILDALRADPSLQHQAVHHSDGINFRRGLLARAGEQMISYAAQFRIESSSPSALASRVAEASHLTAYMAGAAAQHATHAPKYDFYLIHSTNSAIFLPALLAQPWLSPANRIRLLERKIRTDLLLYTAIGSPDLRLDLVRKYTPKQQLASTQGGNDAEWQALERRACAFRDDDGHAVKLVRALAHGQRLAKPYEGQPAFRLTQDDWLTMGHIAMDAVEGPGPKWVFMCGFEEAWGGVPARAVL